MARQARLPRLNADVGEHDASIHDGTQEALLELVDLANIACGGHAGSQASIDATLRQCAARGVLVGAHPSTPDREGFGRRALDLAPEVLAGAVRAQLALLCARAAALGVEVGHVKPHGALYHAMSDDAALARRVVAATRDVCPAAAWVLRARSRGLAALRADGVAMFAEGFVDRRYDTSGGLVSRDAPDCMIDSAEGAAAQALALRASGDVDTLCIHGDHALALDVARAVRAALDAAGAA
jgi:5-oxoprolinase (ATP-hydrolysing) subunit A